MLTDHKINWEKARIVDKSSKYRKRRVQEAVYMAECEGRLNKDGGLLLSNLWLNLLSFYTFSQVYNSIWCMCAVSYCSIIRLSFSISLLSRDEGQH